MPLALQKQIEEYLEELRPALHSDGGDVEFVQIDSKDGTLQLKFIGACSHCSISDVTLTHYIKEQLMQRFPQIKEVMAV